jgi:hypothetical protein
MLSQEKRGPENNSNNNNNIHNNNMKGKTDTDSEIIAAQDQALKTKVHTTKSLQIETERKCRLCK